MTNVHVSGEPVHRGSAGVSANAALKADAPLIAIVSPFVDAEM